MDKEKQELFRQMSEQLACLWGLMNENPNILIQKDSQLVLEFSYNIKKEFNKSMEKVEIAENSYLLILERSMDMKSALMYDLSFQVWNFFNNSSIAGASLNAKKPGTYGLFTFNIWWSSYSIFKSGNVNTT